MFESDDASEPDSAHLERVYKSAPTGALTVAGIATGIVLALWLVFYLAIFLPRAVFR